MLVLLRNTQPHVLSIPHEVRDADGCPFTLQPNGHDGDSRLVDDEALTHPKMAACLAAKWVEVLPADGTSEPPVVPAAAPPPVPELNDPMDATPRAPTSFVLPPVDTYLSDNLSRAASELLWAEDCVAAVFTVQGVEMPVAQTVLRALFMGLRSPAVLRELRRLEPLGLVEPPAPRGLPPAAPVPPPLPAPVPPGEAPKPAPEPEPALVVDAPPAVSPMSTAAQTEVSRPRASRRPA
jgi:hypothetical protein